MGSDGGTEIYDSEIITIEKLENLLKNFDAIKYDPTHFEFESYRYKINKEDIINLSNEEIDKNNIFNEESIYKTLSPH
jgi:hypothetical protein